MAFVDWRIQGIQISNCNCDTGCPCQFNSVPTHGNCRAYVFFQVNSGHFGKVRLDGLRWGGLFMWPGPIHLGEGIAMAVIDERAGTARLNVPDLIEGSAEPIENPVTGAPHRARVLLPTGFEYREAEYVSGTAKATGPIALDFSSTHAHIAKADWGTRGILS